MTGRGSWSVTYKGYKEINPVPSQYEMRMWTETTKVQE